ncbi:sulfotransferase [Pseudoxanthomonas sacheonensis]|uniref:sulfotransferase n=1 Tax=Pseudoxanthomonas sacheonensis TaxID=443615 RepID=UPI0013D2FB9D|nr:sulfotransferase [Pseudoxanthomonas sacheonensis]
MQQNLGPYWAKARDHEAAGDMEAAGLVYQTIVNLDPTQAIAWVRLSDFQRRADHYRAALACAVRAASVATPNARWKSLPYVTHQLLNFDERDAIGAAIEAADWSHPDVLEQSPVLSQRLWLSDHHHLALRLIDHASARLPPSHLLSYSRANALRHVGRTHDATQEFERCLGLSPHYAFAHWSLAYHQKSTVPGSRVERIRRAQAALPQGTLEQVYLGYALFKELDDAGDIEGAWPALETAARLMRQRIDYDPAREARGVAALREIQWRFPQAAPEARNTGQIPVFIVGMPRTGTTLLDRILGNHSQVASAGELNAFSRALSWEADHFYDAPSGEQGVRAVAAANPIDVGARYLRHTTSRHNGHRWLIDKNPVNAFNLGFIARALPQAKLIWVRRNPMDTCFSNLKELFSGNAYGYSYDQAELADHYLRFKALGEYWQETLGDRLHVVDYEDLVADPTKNSEAALRFCGLEFEPDCVDITRNAAPVSTASSSQVRQPIHSRGVDAWKKYADHLEPLRQRLTQGQAQAR